MKMLTTAILASLMFSACGPSYHYEYIGPKGEKGDAGEAGDTGPVGPSGPVGPQGLPGIDGTSVTVVKLCPGTTVYPSKFVEVAFCINSKLYAVYSQNGGFETEIPPGSYGSNGINANCNFVVLPNCNVQN